ncbi:MAG: hypothetical protein Q4G30_08315 [Actinomycetaceae bacterium]|nr:hypothetical protein [Actinomycetaceae bacterium]
MVATRYLVEGERLDVLLSQVRRLGRQVTVLKAEKVRSGGLGGFFAKEHYELLVEVQDTGSVPANFRPASAARSGGGAGASQRAAVSTKTTDIPAEGGSQVSVESGSGSVEAIKEEDELGLTKLLDAARNQISTITEEASAQVDAQLAAMIEENHTVAEPAEANTLAIARADQPVQGVAAVAAAGFGEGGAGAVSRGPARTPSTPVQTGLDPRLTGAGAPGMSAQPSGSMARPAAVVLGGSVSEVETTRMTELGIPLAFIPQTATDSGVGNLAEYIARFPQAPDPLAEPGSVIVVIGPAPIATAVVDVAGRLAGRIGGKAYCVMGGAKTLLPGEGLRVRSSDELVRMMASKPDGICVLALADSMVDSHRRIVSKLLSVIYVDQCWAVVDARNSVQKLEGWLYSLPDAAKADVLAVQRIWEAEKPGAVLGLGLPVGMLDGTPAKPAAWQMLLEEKIN